MPSQNSIAEYHLALTAQCPLPPIGCSSPPGDPCKRRDDRKMAIAMCRSYSETSGRGLRAAVVTEVKRLADDPVQGSYSSWKHDLSRDLLRKLVTRPDSDSVPYTNVYANRIGNRATVPITDVEAIELPIGTGVSNPKDNTNGISRRILPTALNPQPSASRPSGVTSGNQPHLPTATEPPSKCFAHRDDPNPPKCGACADARRAHDAWDAERAEHERADALARYAEARRAGEDRARAIAACGLCDPDGYVGTSLCDHDPATVERNRAGSARARQALEEARAARGAGADQCEACGATEGANELCDRCADVAKRTRATKRARRA